MAESFVNPFRNQHQQQHRQAWIWFSNSRRIKADFKDLELESQKLISSLYILACYQARA